MFPFLLRIASGNALVVGMIASEMRFGFGHVFGLFRESISNAGMRESLGKAEGKRERCRVSVREPVTCRARRPWAGEVCFLFVSPGVHKGKKARLT